VAIPVVIQKPVIHITDKDGGTAVDVSCDISLVDLTPDQAVTEVKRFCGTVQVPGLLTESCSVDYVVNDTTTALWAPLVGKYVTVEVWESDADAAPRTFDSYIGFNPGNYGTFDPGEALTVTGQALPVMSEISRGTSTPTAP